MNSSDITSYLSSLFGANWRTSIFGLLALIFGGMSTQQDLLDFLTVDHATWSRGLCRLLAFICASIFVFVTKDSKVTGGSVASTPEAISRLANGKDPVDSKPTT